MHSLNKRKLSNWILVLIYLILALFIIDIYFIHEFFPIFMNMCEILIMSL